MRYRPDHKEAARAKIVDAAGRAFRRLGYGGAGVDGLAKEAGLTSGAFYGHFASKADAFEVVALAGLVELREAIEALKAKQPDAWLTTFVDYYLTTNRTCELGESCALQSLTLDVARAGRRTRIAFEAELSRVVDAVAAGLPGRTRSERRGSAWAILSTLSGGVTLARASGDPKVGVEIARSLESAIAAIVDAGAKKASRSRGRSSPTPRHRTRP